MHESFIEIKQKAPGYNAFFGSWVCQDDLMLVVDVGPANTADRLIKSLASMGLCRVDYVLLTHIHIDHAGALSDFLNRYPMAKVICHEKGLKYLLEPSKLWVGSRKLLGKIAEIYGPPKPVPRERLIPHTKCDLKDLSIIETPGHALHHLTFSYRNRLFVGEAGGNYFVVKDEEYLRPATPPRFFLNLCLQSLDRLLELDDQPICYAHFGGAESSHRLLKMSRDQLMRWHEIIYEHMIDSDGELVKKCLISLLKKDPCLGAFNNMTLHTQRRERFFLTNSIKGFVGFLQENT
jgi:glyoxylase-like metal-dependent hydrolase (beta-lactamase superfamily II)